MDAESLKSEILLLLKTEISAVIKSEMKSALAEDFDFLKNELQALKAEVKNNTAAIYSEINQMKTTIHVKMVRRGDDLADHGKYPEGGGGRAPRQ